jgi:hypothetical protein
MSKGGANEATSITRIVSRRERVFGTPHHRCTFGRFWTSPTARQSVGHVVQLPDGEAWASEEVRFHRDEQRRGK